MKHQAQHVTILTFIILRSSTSQCPVSRLPSGWTRVNIPGSDFCYAISPIRNSQHNGHRQCLRTFKGYLAKFHDAETMLAVTRRIRLNTNSIWFDAISSEGDWIWSDGTSIARDVLRRKQQSENFGLNACGVLTSKSTPKFSKWKDEYCEAHHEFLCQAPKLNIKSKDCAGNAFSLFNKCYVISESCHTFQNSMTQCNNVMNGNLAPLSNTEIFTAAVNYFERKVIDKKAKLWLDVTWDSTTRQWMNVESNKTVSSYEQNWSSHTNHFAEGGTSAVLDREISWKWRTWKPESLAYYVCEVDPKISGRGVSPDVNINEVVTSRGQNESTTTSLSEEEKSSIDPIIIGIVGLFTAVIVAVVVACFFRHKRCCFQRKIPDTPIQDLSSPAFSFANVSYGNIIERTESPSPHLSERRDLPDLPDNDMIYETIDEKNDAVYATPIPVENSISLPRTTAGSRTNKQDAAVHASTTIPRPSENFTAVSTHQSRFEQHKSPSYVPMKTQENSQSDPILQHVQLPLSSNDEPPAEYSSTVSQGVPVQGEDTYSKAYDYAAPITDYENSTRVVRSSSEGDHYETAFIHDRKEQTFQ